MTRMTIWKFEVPIAGSVDLGIPIGATIVHVCSQRPDMLTFWAMVDQQAQLETRTFKIVGTGYDFDGRWQHVGSILVGPFIWHLLEAVPEGSE